MPGSITNAAIGFNIQVENEASQTLSQAAQDFTTLQDAAVAAADSVAKSDATMSRAQKAGEQASRSHKHAVEVVVEQRKGILTTTNELLTSAAALHQLSGVSSRVAEEQAQAFGTVHETSRGATQALFDFVLTLLGMKDASDDAATTANTRLSGSLAQVEQRLEGSTEEGENFIDVLKALAENKKALTAGVAGAVLGGQQALQFEEFQTKAVAATGATRRELEGLREDINSVALATDQDLDKMQDTFAILADRDLLGSAQDQFAEFAVTMEKSLGIGAERSITLAAKLRDLGGVATEDLGKFNNFLLAMQERFPSAEEATAALEAAISRAQVLPEETRQQTIRDMVAFTSSMNQVWVDAGDDFANSITEAISKADSDSRRQLASLSGLVQRGGARFRKALEEEDFTAMSRLFTESIQNLGDASQDQIVHARALADSIGVPFEELRKAASGSAAAALEEYLAVAEKATQSTSRLEQVLSEQKKSFEEIGTSAAVASETILTELGRPMEKILVAIVRPFADAFVFIAHLFNELPQSIKTLISVTLFAATTFTLFRIAVRGAARGLQAVVMKNEEFLAQLPLMGKERAKIAKGWAEKGLGIVNRGARALGVMGALRESVEGLKFSFSFLTPQIALAVGALALFTTIAVAGPEQFLIGMQQFISFLQNLDELIYEFIYDAWISIWSILGDDSLKQGESIGQDLVMGIAGAIYLTPELGEAILDLFSAITVLAISSVGLIAGGVIIAVGELVRAVIDSVIEELVGIWNAFFEEGILGALDESSASISDALFGLFDLGKSIVGISLLIGGFKALWVAITMGFHPMSMLITFLTPLGNVLEFVWIGAMKLYGAFSASLLPAMKNVALAAGGKLMAAFTAMQAFIMETMIPTLAALWTNLLAVEVTILGITAPVWAVVAAVVAVIAVIGAVIYWWDELYAFISDFVVDAWEWLAGFFSDVSSGFWSLVGMIESAAMTLVDILVSIGKELAFVLLLGPFYVAFRLLDAALSQFGFDLEGFVTDLLGRIGTWLFQTGKDLLTDPFGTAYDMITHIFDGSGLFDFFVELLERTGDFLLNTAVDLITSPFQLAWDVISSIFSLDSVSGLFLAVTETASGALSSLASFFGFGDAAEQASVAQTKHLNINQQISPRAGDGGDRGPSGPSVRVQSRPQVQVAAPITQMPQAEQVTPNVVVSADEKEEEIEMLELMKSMVKELQKLNRPGPQPINRRTAAIRSANNGVLADLAGSLGIT